MAERRVAGGEVSSVAEGVEVVERCEDAARVVWRFVGD
jgi:hypothetical protein